MYYIRLMVVCLIGACCMPPQSMQAQSFSSLPSNPMLFFADAAAADFTALPDYPFWKDAPLRGRRLTINWMQPYGSALSTYFSAGYSMYRAGSRLELVLTQSGSRYLSQSGLRLAYYRQLSEKLAGGLGLGLLAISGEEDMFQLLPQTDLWVRFSLTEHTRIGLWIEGILWKRESTAGSLMTPPTVYAGLRHQFANQLHMGTELRYAPLTGYSWLLSAHLLPHAKVQLSASLDLLHFHFFTGASFQFKNYMLMVGLHSHLQLGITPAAGAAFWR